MLHYVISDVFQLSLFYTKNEQETTWQVRLFASLNKYNFKNVLEFFVLVEKTVINFFFYIHIPCVIFSVSCLFIFGNIRSWYYNQRHLFLSVLPPPLLRFTRRSFFALKVRVTHKKVIFVLNLIKKLKFAKSDIRTVHFQEAKKDRPKFVATRAWSCYSADKSDENKVFIAPEEESRDIE